MPLTLLLFACEKEEAPVNYTADYVGTVEFESNGSSSGGPIELIDTLYKDVSIGIFPGKEEGTWALKVYEKAPLLIDNFKIIDGSFDFIRSNPATMVWVVKGELLDDSMNVAYNFRVSSPGRYERWTIKALKKSN